MPTETLTNDEEEIEVTPSCGNVFADLGLPDPELLLAKAKLSIKIERLIKERRLTQKQAAKLMGLTLPDVSDLLRGRLDGFTLDHLFRCLDALGQEIEIIVRPKQAREKAEAMATPV
ncbi:MAG: helix-turn-helix domain-containing protein [Armatimonadota bacterium]|nr:helix-turn-helix domain-containing protein [Armatimonadota bacterium]